MTFIDVHCHLDFYGDKKIEELVERARKKGVEIIVNNAVKPESIKKVFELARKFEEVKAALGIYPIDALAMEDKAIDEQIELIRKNKNEIVAIGEVGIDFKEDSEEHERQKKTFQKFIDLAMELDKPIIVHSRMAEKEVVDALEASGAKKVVLHCFSGSLELEKRAEDNGWYFSIPTNVKYSKQFQALAKEVPLSQILCETDSPFLHPDKKKDNEPANVIESYKKIAEIKGITLEEAEKKIEENYKRLFG